MLFIRDTGLSYDGHGAPPVSGLSLLVEGDRIAAVGPATDLAARAKAAGAQEIDGRGLTAIPGLVDAHLHLTLTAGSDPLGRVARADLAELAADAALNAQRCLAAGMTTLCDCGSPGQVGLALARLSRAVGYPLPHIQSCGPCLTTTGGHGEAIGLAADSGLELRRRVRRLSRDGADFIKIMATGGSLDPRTNRGRAQYSARELSIAIVDAHRLGRRVVCHANGTEGIANAVRAGADVVAHCNWLSGDGESLEWDPAVADELVQQGIAIDLNVKGAVSEVLDRRSGSPVRRWDLLRPLAGRGAAVYLTSDGFGADASSFPSQLVAVAGALGLPTHELIQRVTTIPSRVIGSADTAGGLTVGSRADVLLLDGDLSEDLASLERPRLVIAGGAIVAADGAVRMSRRLDGQR